MVSSHELPCKGNLNSAPSGAVFMCVAWWREGDSNPNSWVSSHKPQPALPPQKSDCTIVHLSLFHTNRKTFLLY